MSTAYVLLGLLAHGGPQHGYELKREHDARLPRSRPLAFGQVYATIGRLTRDGLITEAGHDSEGGPERTSYAVTEAGRTALTAWLGTIEKPAPYVTDLVFTKVVVGLLTASDHALAHGYLTAQRAAHLQRMRELTAVKTTPDAPLADVVAADYALAHLDADLQWIRTTLDRLDRLHHELQHGEHA
ncbi:MAG: PadR family transcriptional regulator [Actinocatenispora sp.]